MKSFFIVLILSLSTSDYLTAQYNNTDTIGYGKHDDTYYFYQNKKINESKLKPFLIQYNLSAIEYKKYSNWSTPGTIVLLVGLIAGVIDFTKLKDDKFWNPYSTTLFSSLAIGIPLRMISFKYLKHSVKLYNEEVQSH